MDVKKRIVADALAHFFDKDVDTNKGLKQKISEHIVYEVSIESGHT